MFCLATANLAVAAATGVATQTGAIDTRPVRWVHHALYGSSLVTSLAALAAARGPARRLALVPPVAVLLALPRARGGSAAHTLGAGVAAVGYLGAACVR